jgi:hypothetical protein
MAYYLRNRVAPSQRQEQDAVGRRSDWRAFYQHYVRTRDEVSVPQREAASCGLADHVEFSFPSPMDQDTLPSLLRPQAFLRHGQVPDVSLAELYRVGDAPCCGGRRNVHAGLMLTAAFGGCATRRSVDDTRACLRLARAR